MAARRELLDRRPSARPTTRRSFGSAIRSQLPSADADAEIVHAPPVRPAPPKPAAPVAAAASASASASGGARAAGGKRGRRAADESSESESGSATDEARADAAEPKRTRTVLREEERLEREQDEEYREEAEAPRKAGKAARATAEDVVLAAVMQVVEEFIVEDASREGAALLRFREELAATFGEERRALQASAALRADAVRLARERRRLREEALAAKERRAAVQARLGALEGRARRLRAQAGELEAAHGLVADVADLSAATAPVSEASKERVQALNLAGLLAGLRESARTVAYVRALNASLAKCLERLDEL